MGQWFAFFLKMLPDLLPAFVIKVESGRKDADRLALVVGDDPGFFKFAGHKVWMNISVYIDKIQDIQAV